MIEDYTKWPWSHIDQRYHAALHYQYGQASHRYVEHVQSCDTCDIDGLCQTGAELNKQCRELEEQIKEEQA